MWAFIYLGANVDAFAEAGGIGIAPQNTANYVNTNLGIAAMYAQTSSAVLQMRATGSNVASNLGGDINEDGSVSNKRDAWQPPQAA
jgi:hypothetical protein